MKRSGSQKFLLVISIINAVLGALAVVYGIVSIARGNVGGTTVEELMASGVSAVEAEQIVASYTTVTILAIATGIYSLVMGVLGVRAANDNQKIMPVWFISLLGVGFAISNVFAAIFQGSFQLTTLLYLVGPILMFWVANNIRGEAGK